MGIGSQLMHQLKSLDKIFDGFTPRITISALSCYAGLTCTKNKRCKEKKFAIYSSVYIEQFRVT